MTLAGTKTHLEVLETLDTDQSYRLRLLDYCCWRDPDRKKRTSRTWKPTLKPNNHYTNIVLPGSLLLLTRPIQLLDKNKNAPRDRGNPSWPCWCRRRLCIGTCTSGCRPPPRIRTHPPAPPKRSQHPNTTRRKSESIRDIGITRNNTSSSSGT